MKKTDIMEIINAENTNKDIKWSIVENTETNITLTNSYDKSVNFTITVKHDDEEWIAVRDNHMNRNVAGFLKGDSKWDDYRDTETGLKLGIEAAVSYFNYMY